MQRRGVNRIVALALPKGEIGWHSLLRVSVNRLVRPRVEDLGFVVSGVLHETTIDCQSGWCVHVDRAESISFVWIFHTVEHTQLLPIGNSAEHDPMRSRRVIAVLVNDRLAIRGERRARGHNGS